MGDHKQRVGRIAAKHESQTPPPNRIRALLRWTSYVVVAVVYIYVSTALWVFQGPFPALKSYLIDSLDATRHGYLLRPLSLYTVSEKVIKAHALSNNLVSQTVAVSNLHIHDFSGHHSSSVTLSTYQGKTFKAFIMEVSDPSRIRVVATKYLHQRGETVQEMVNDTGAVAGINAGGFIDSNWQGTGAYPQGITMTNGNLVAITGSKTNPQPVIAFTKGGQMIAGAYSLPQLKKLGVVESVGFGPVLVENGKAVPTTDGYDLNPRTAIGQTASGAVILIVTDGRFATGPNDAGASYDDVKNLMLQHGAVIAANLDGGSSATMIYHGTIENRPVDILGQRSVATSIVVMPSQGGVINHG